ncbi:MAG: type II toxin-antitoxin system VapC family toxin [Bacteroidetes bacterium]|nr:type II toxin-antitoxin system VapC family toxin [Bacteroidota bacterium]
MSGNNFLIDTNVALFLLSGNKTVANLINDKQLYISFVTQLELLGYNGISNDEISKVKQFIDECVIIDINSEIKDRVIEIRKKYAIKLPDAIIAATSIYIDAPLLSADKGFKKITALQLILIEE